MNNSDNIMISISEKHAKAFTEYVQWYDAKKRMEAARQREMMRQLHEEMRDFKIGSVIIIATLLAFMAMLIWENRYLADIIEQL